MVILFSKQRASELLTVAASLLLLAFAGCATVQQPQRQNLVSDDGQIRDCARSFKELDAVVAGAGVADIAARRVEGFPYLRTDRFTASFAESAISDAPVREAWIDRMRELDAAGRRVEIANLPAAEIDRFDVSGRDELVSLTHQCAALMLATDLRHKSTIELLAQRARVKDDYSSTKRFFGLYAITRLPFYSGVTDWQEEATQKILLARRGEPPEHPVVRYLPPDVPVYSRAQVRELLAGAATDPLGLPQISEQQRERLFATYAPVLEIETTGDFDRIGKLLWSDSDTPAVEVSRPTVYRRLAFTRYEDRTLLQLVYVAWLPERPKDSNTDLLGGQLDGIVWRVTLAPTGEPVLFDSIHPCGCYHTFFPTPRIEPLPSPQRTLEWAFTPAVLPSIGEDSRLVISAETRTHYLRNVWPAESGDGTPYSFADYDELRTLPLPTGGSRSAFGPNGLVPGTERGERYLFWPMGIASPGAMRQSGTQATAFVGRRHFDDADLIELRFRLKE
ncbi:MAG: hypothetical protein JSU95_09275 [Betaproteobacteria bacterium]|nr:MAG: hypothetical protein JSU95_09275 [Betaproteobacteria bacterium]